MFKKASEAKSFSRLSGADRKKLKRTIRERFSQASDADIDIILPPKVEITVSKLPNRALVYGVEGGYPMLFDVDGRGSEIYPTVYTLWEVPDLLPAFILKGGEVSRFVLGGADLMFPGISISPEGLPSFLSGQPWAVKVPGNPAPIAVGSTLMSSAEALKAGLRGKALRILHYYRDSLWESVGNRFVPNAGFFEDVVFEDPSSIENFEESETGPQVTSSSEMQGSGQNVQPDLIADLELQTENEDQFQNPDKTKTTEVLEAEISSLSIADNVPAEPSEERELQALSREEIDMLLDKCLLQALHTSVKENDLPMSGSTLWSGHVLSSRPPGTSLDIKKSSFKKLAKWLMSKSSSGLISAKEDKHKKEVMILSVNRSHPDYTSFKPDKRKIETNDQASNSSTSDIRQSKPVLEVIEIFKPTTHLNPIFQAVGEDTGKYYTYSEASDVVFNYVEKNNLVKPSDKAVVVLDAYLCDALYKGAVKKGSSYPSEIHKKDLGNTFLGRMQVHQKVARGNDSALRKGAIRPVQLVTERRQGNKKVTRFSGLETFLMDAEVLASELQKKFACSTSLAELPGKKGQYEVLVQGGVIDDLARYLIDHYGVPKKYIEVLDKTKK